MHAFGSVGYISEQDRYYRVESERPVARCSQHLAKWDNWVQTLAEIAERALVHLCPTPPYISLRYVGWGCVLNCFMLSSLPWFYAFCWSAIPTSCYSFDVFFYSCKLLITAFMPGVHAIGIVCLKHEMYFSQQLTLLPWVSFIWCTSYAVVYGYFISLTVLMVIA